MLKSNLYLNTLLFAEDQAIIQDSEDKLQKTCLYEGWNFNSGNYLFTTDTK